jgi:cysteine synthase B
MMEGASLLPSAESDALLRTIGNTPLIPLLRIGREFAHVRILAKAEWCNPGGSVKDRPAYRMIRAAELSGQLTPAKIILDATSGNTGIAYAMIAARRGYRCKLLMPSNASPERKKLLKAYGAEVAFTDPAEGSDGAFYAAQRMRQEQPDLYFYADQYGNPENPRAHYETTAPEIIQQTEGQITHFLAGMGTSGTLMGTGKRLREFNGGIQLIAVQPDGPFHGLEGLKHMETSSHVPALYDAEFPNETVGISTEAAQQMARRMTREEGLYIGVSAGAAICAALKVASTIQEGVLVVICPDAGARYQSEKFWEAT